VTATRRPSRDAGFTLTELLVVMAVVSILAVVTLVSMRVIGRDARLASAVNAVTASLDNARALAIKSNRVVLLVFQPRLENDREMVVDLVPCHWTGESWRNTAQGGDLNVVDRFVAIPDAPVRTLPRGIKVAAPLYGVLDPDVDDPRDGTWTTQPHLPLTRLSPPREVAGSLLGVMYGPDGTTLSSNSQSSSDLIWADLVRDEDEFSASPVNPTVRLAGQDFDPDDVTVTFDQVLPDDEPFVRIAPFIAVYDDDEARERGSGSIDAPAWNDSGVYEQELTGTTGYISNAGRRIHFNVYTGVAMK
jgi:prepilin-type N-terminal cleavage/methylation domain-containing protein